MDLRLVASISIGKISKRLVNLTKSGGTAAPGLFSLKLDQNALTKLTEPLTSTILISGTNGKTTTARLIGDILHSNQIKFIHNRHGSNLERGLISALIPEVNFAGELPVQTALFEVDEAALSVVLPKLKPSVVVLTNLFRDQLDRYGEVDNIKRLWEKALARLPESTTLVLNADDPSLAFLGSKVKCKVFYFGINDPTIKLIETPSVLDSSRCPQCHSDLHYSHYYSSHQGEYSCPNCEFRRPKLDIEANEVQIKSHKVLFILKDGNEQQKLEPNLPGLYNIYNTLAAYAATKALSLPLTNYHEVLRNFSAVFGRGEKVGFDGREILITLAKNPTGFNEIIRTFLHKPNQTILIAINDKIADGRDVSWLWDVDFEKMTDKNNKLVVSGIRATDMGLRLKYAGMADFTIEEDLASALENALSETRVGETLTIIPTYTAMLAIKKLLSSKNISGEFWED